MFSLLPLINIHLKEYYPYLFLIPQPRHAQPNISLAGIPFHVHVSEKEGQKQTSLVPTYEPTNHDRTVRVLTPPATI